MSAGESRAKSSRHLQTTLWRAEHCEVLAGRSHASGCRVASIAAPAALQTSHERMTHLACQVGVFAEVLLDTT